MVTFEVYWTLKLIGESFWYDIKKTNRVFEGVESTEDNGFYVKSSPLPGNNKN